MSPRVVTDENTLLMHQQNVAAHLAVLFSAMLNEQLCLALDLAIHNSQEKCGSSHR